MTTALEEYTEKSDRLEQMIRDGKGDSAEADALRDTMDGPWRRMTADELKQFRERKTPA